MIPENRMTAPLCPSSRMMRRFLICAAVSGVFVATAGSASVSPSRHVVPPALLGRSSADPETATTIEALAESAK